jgi:hypothetical protein
MVIPLIITLVALWILILSLLIGVCLSARQGDLQQQQLNVAPVHPVSYDPIGPPATSPGSDRSRPKGRARTPTLLTPRS